MWARVARVLGGEAGSWRVGLREESGFGKGKGGEVEEVEEEEVHSR